MTEPAHSKFSASAAKRWLACPGSVPLSEGKTDKGSKYAAWGTVAHNLADQCLQSDTVLDAGALGQIHKVDGFVIEVDQDMIDCVNTYLTNVREMTAGADLFQSETRTNYSSWLNVPEADGWGTADATAIVGPELQVHDLKTGAGVPVDVKDSEQLMLYAGGKLREMEDLGLDIETVRLVIHQPRIKPAPSEWSIDREELVAWLLGRARSGAGSVLNAELGYANAADGALPAVWVDTFLRPGEDQCRFCKAKATCPALRSEVAQTVQGDNIVDDIDAEMFAPHVPELPDHLAVCLSKVDMIEDWCSAIRAEAHRRLEAGEHVPGYKLVAGKRGARQWADAAKAEEQLRAFRLKTEQMYDLKLISPTSAEKLTKDGAIGPRQWPKLQSLITQNEGKPTVAPASDPRPAIDVRPIEEAFENLADDIC